MAFPNSASNKTGNTAIVSDSFDPRVVPYLAAPGTLYVLRARNKSSLVFGLFQKIDHGLTTNWVRVSPKGPSCVMFVAPDGSAEFTSIQDAIDAAVAAGHDETDPAFIFVACGMYVEDLAFASGVHVIGDGGKNAKPVQIAGMHTFSPSAIVADTTLLLRGLYFSCVGGVGLTITGTLASTVTIDKCWFEAAPGNAAACISHAGDRTTTEVVRSQITNDVVGGVGVSIDGGIVFASILRLVNDTLVTAAGVCAQVNDNGGLGIDGAFLASTTASSLIEINAVPGILITNNSSFQNSGGHFVEFTVINGNLIASHAFINVTGKVAAGVGNNTYSHANCTYFNSNTIEQVVIVENILTTTVVAGP